MSKKIDLLSYQVSSGIFEIYRNLDFDFGLNNGIIRYKNYIDITIANRNKLRDCIAKITIN